MEKRLVDGRGPRLNRKTGEPGITPGVVRVWQPASSGFQSAGATHAKISPNLTLGSSTKSGGLLCGRFWQLSRLHQRQAEICASRSATAYAPVAELRPPRREARRDISTSSVGAAFARDGNIQKKDTCRSMSMAGSLSFSVLRANAPKRGPLLLPWLGCGRAPCNHSLPVRYQILNQEKPLTTALGGLMLNVAALP
jgi:hypothetical protein